MRLPLSVRIIGFLVWLISSALGDLVRHDETFEPDFVLRVTGQNISQACGTRYSAVVNGTSPGPPIRIQAGRAAWIRVYNDMEHENLTMHWHGLAQRMAEFSDGSPLGSQYPLRAQTFFDYEIQTDPLESGTYFYHSHIGMQALTAVGALIIEDCGDSPYQYDAERILMWHEHYGTNDEDFEAGLLAAPLRFGGEVQALLLNGRGVKVNHTAGELGPGDKSCQLPVIDVLPGMTYRFRFIGGTSLAHSMIAFESHDDLSIIAADGSYTQPEPVTRVQIGSGQRFDVLFKTKTIEELQAARKTDFHVQFETRDRPAIFRGYAILRYDTPTGVAEKPITAAPATPVLALPNVTYDWLEQKLRPLRPDPDFPTLAEVTRRVVLPTVQELTPEGTIVWKIAGLNWNELVAQQTPLLVDIYLRGEAAMPNMTAALANNGWDPRTKSFPVRAGEVLEVVLQNTGSLVNNGGGVDDHPWHAHGQHFYDLGSGNGSYDPEAVDAARVAANYTPVKRDTTMLYRYGVKTTPGAPAGWRAWRFRVLDPGVWMIHCHVLQHMVMGMQSVWVVGNASDIQKIPTDLGVGYFSFGGSVVGNESYWPLVNHQFNHTTDQCKPKGSELPPMKGPRAALLTGDF